MCSALYDSGYDAHYAFRRGFEAAGGTVVASEVVDAIRQPAAWQRAWQAVAAASPDVIYGGASGSHVALCVQGYAASGLAGRAPLVGAGLLLDDAAIAQLGGAASGLRGAGSWASGLTTAANQAFSQAFGQRAGRAPDAFAVLGYEAGLLIAAALEATASRRSGAALGSALRSATITGPRGAVQAGGAAPLLLREVRATGGRAASAAVSGLDAFAPPSAERAALASIAKTGFLYPYLCL